MVSSLSIPATLRPVGCFPAARSDEETLGPRAAGSGLGTEGRVPAVPSPPLVVGTCPDGSLCPVAVFSVAGGDGTVGTRQPAHTSASRSRLEWPLAPGEFPGAFPAFVSLPGFVLIPETA